MRDNDQQQGTQEPQEPQESIHINIEVSASHWATLQEMDARGWYPANRAYGTRYPTPEHPEYVIHYAENVLFHGLMREIRAYKQSFCTHPREQEAMNPKKQWMIYDPKDPEEAIGCAAICPDCGKELKRFIFDEVDLKQGEGE